MMKTSEEYQCLTKVLFAELSTWSLEKLALELALELVGQEMRKDAEATLAPIELQARAAENAKDRAGQLLLKRFDDLSREVPDLMRAVETARARALGESGLKAANERHDKPGGSREKQQRMRELWATGNYQSRDECAEREHAALGMAYQTARNALRNIPKA